MVLSLIAMPKVVKADSEPLEPDFVTDSMIILDPEIVPLLKQGTLSIVSFAKGNIIGFQVGYAHSTNLIVILDESIDVPITQPVALILKRNILEIYLSPVHSIELEEVCLSISSDYSNLLNSYFPILLSAQIVKAEQVGIEKEVDYCCNPPLTTINYDYVLYLATGSRTNPYELASVL